MSISNPPITLADLTPAVRAALCNGCGPSRWKYAGHTWRWKWLALKTPGARAICDAHDLAYWVGGTDADRLAADERLRTDIIALAQTRWFGARWLLEAEAGIFYRFVRDQGAQFFALGPQRTLHDLLVFDTYLQQAPQGIP